MGNILSNVRSLDDLSIDLIEAGNNIKITRNIKSRDVSMIFIYPIVNTVSFNIDGLEYKGKNKNNIASRKYIIMKRKNETLSRFIKNAHDLLFNNFSKQEIAHFRINDRPPKKLYIDNTSKFCSENLVEKFASIDKNKKYKIDAKLCFIMTSDFWWKKLVVTNMTETENMEAETDDTKTKIGDDTNILTADENSIDDSDSIDTDDIEENLDPQ